MDFKNKDELPISELVNSDYTVFMYRQFNDYQLVDSESVSQLYIQYLSEEIKLFNMYTEDKKCRRIYYFMVLRNLFRESMFKLKGVVVYIPLIDYYQTRVLIIYDINQHYNDITESITNLYIHVRQVNNLRYQNSKVEDQLMVNYLNSLVDHHNIFEIKPIENTIYISTYAISNHQNDRGDIYKYIINFSKQCECYFLLPNLQCGPYVKSKNIEFSNSLLIQKADGNMYRSVYSDHAFLPSDFWGYCNVAPVNEIIYRLGYDNKNKQWKYKKGPLFVSSSIAYSRTLWFVVGNFKRTPYQSLKESVTQLIVVSRLLRKVIGFDSNYIYNLRVFEHMRTNPDDIILMSQDSTAYNKDNSEVISTSGHAINLIVGAAIQPIDVPHWFDTIICNMKRDSKYDKVIKILEENNDLPELKDKDHIWHVSSDFINVYNIVILIIDLFKFPKINMKFIDRMLKKCISMKITSPPRVKLMLEENITQQKYLILTTAKLDDIFKIHPYNMQSTDFVQYSYEIIEGSHINVVFIEPYRRKRKKLKNVRYRAMDNRLKLYHEKTKCMMFSQVSELEKYFKLERK
jgi:hypothetical protein